MVETAQRSGRRRLRFQCYEDILDDVRKLAAGETRALGNWSLGQVCKHLALAIDKSIDSTMTFRVPLKTRVLVRIFRGRILSGRLPSGFQLPPEAAPLLPEPAATVSDGLAALEQAIARLRSTSQRVPHPVFGKMNPSQWDQFHLRHGEMHLSFIVPAESATA
jgi:hypothetical protein